MIYTSYILHTLDVASDTSRMIRSKAAVSSACFWLCRAIFSLNFRGLAILTATILLTRSLNLVVAVYFFGFYCCCCCCSVVSVKLVSILIYTQLDFFSPFFYIVVRYFGIHVEIVNFHRNSEYVRFKMKLLCIYLLFAKCLSFFFLVVLYS